MTPVAIGDIQRTQGTLKTVYNAKNHLRHLYCVYKQAKVRKVFEDMEAKERKVREKQAQEVAERARNRWRKQKRFAYTMLKQIKDDVAEDPLTSSDDEADVEESRKDVKHRRRKQLVKSMKTLGALIDEAMEGEMEVDPKTKKRVPKKSLVTKTYERYIAAKKVIPQKIQGGVHFGSSR